MSDPNTYYQVGDAAGPEPDDLEFLEYDAAEDDALTLEADYVVAIWERKRDTGHATTIRLIWEGEIWYPS